MKRSRMIAALLAAVLAVTAAAPAIPRAEAADAGFVLETLQTLRENYVDPLSPVMMLNAALTSLEQKTGMSPFSRRVPQGVSDTLVSGPFTQRFDEISSRGHGQYSVSSLLYRAS